MKIIANPHAGHGQNSRNLGRLHDLLQDRGIQYELLQTRRSGHATELARQLICAGERRLVVMGGDGTLGEVVEGVVSGTADEVELGLISVGTGNDVARSLKLPINNLGAALDVVQSGSARYIDVGRERERCFISVLGYGFPATVASETNRMKWLKGSPAFFVAVYKALHRMKPMKMKIVLDDRTLELQVTSVLVQNTPYTGGGLMMAPEALVDDGLLDVVVVGEIGKIDLMLNFPKAYRGRHFEHPSFALYRSSKVRIESPVPREKMFDGDIQGQAPIEVEVLPRRIKLIVPRI